MDEGFSSLTPRTCMFPTKRHPYQPSLPTKDGCARQRCRACWKEMRSSLKMNVFKGERSKGP
jgi:hypothetical protein